jgi:hypothetical protein
METIEWVEIEEDGVVHLYHPETGEYAGPKSKWLAPEVTTEEDALAVLRAIADVKSRQVGVQSKYNLLIKQQDRELRRLQNREAWLLQTYQNQLGRYAEGALPRKADGSLRIKTLTTPWGDIAVRETRDKYVVTNEDAAVFWCEDHCPDAVKYKKTILVSQLTDEIRQKIVEDSRLMSFHGLSYVPAEIKYVISTIGKDE